jgi:hypothetical protein
VKLKTVNVRLKTANLGLKTECRAVNCEFTGEGGGWGVGSGRLNVGLQTVNLGLKTMNLGLKSECGAENCEFTGERGGWSVGSGRLRRQRLCPHSPGRLPAGHLHGPHVQVSEHSVNIQ